MNITSKIPLTEYNQIIQTNSCPETIAALLNEAEERYSSLQKNLVRKRIYPFWKICQICNQPFQAHTKAQATKNKTCSKVCKNAMIGLKNSGETPPEQRSGMEQAACSVCGISFYRNKKHLVRVQHPVCSRQCNGVLRGEEWKQHAHKGRQNWKTESEKALVERMTGETNPSWKGGITYKRPKGNHKGAKYIRCPEEYLDMARKDGYIMEHRLLVAQHIGRMLSRTEVVHHINHDPLDNRIENLMLFANNSDHKRFENGQDIKPLWQP